MRTLMQSFLVMLATATDRQLAKHVQYLKIENKILRGRLGPRILVRPKERRQLLKFGRPVGKAIKDLIGIVTPRTFLQWMNDAKDEPGKRARKRKQPGRPRTAEEVRKLTILLAKENGWGFDRIVGELKKLGIAISKSTVKNLLITEGLDPCPKRSQKSWAEFIKQHAETLWATDFFTKKVWTMKGLVDVFVLFFIHVESRRVYLAGMTAHPDNTWMKQQAKNVSMHWDGWKLKPTHLIRDFDTKYTSDFDAILKAENVEIKKVGPRKPNLNAYAERFVQSIKQECLDHFLCFGEEHLRYIVKTYIDWYNTYRPHQGKDNKTLEIAECQEWKEGDNAEEIVFTPRLGGLLKHYHRRAA